MKRIFFGIGRALGATGRATVALVGICGVVAALANYAVTQGSGTNFGSIVVSTVHYAQQLICDSVTPAQCVTVSAAGAAKVDGSAVTQPISAASLPTHGVTVASGGIASGGVASGAVVDLGAQSDAAAGTDTATASLIALIKRVAQNITTLNNTAGASTPAGTNTTGNVGSDPSSGKGTPSSVAINVSTATTTQLVAISASTKIYVTSFDVIAGGTGNITFEYGTGASCGTGTTVLTGAYNLTAQAGIAKGDGQAAVLVVPAGNALCVLTSAAVQMSGSVSYQQF